MSDGFPMLGLVSTFPPTQCGIATFAHSLAAAWAAQNPKPHVGVMRIVGPGDNSRDAGEVDGRFDPSHRASLVGTVRHLDRYDCVLIEHEYGLFGPEDGIAVLDLLDELSVPVVVTLHSVLSHPTSRQRMIMEGLVGGSFGTIVLSRVSEARLRGVYDVPSERVVVIPHGTHGLVSEGGRPIGNEPEVLTWGLVGPGKGIEWAIRAVARLQDIGVRYRVLGRTHPNVLTTDGETYRRGLERLAQELGLQDVVRFENRYVDLSTLEQRVGAARVVILPYDSLEQVVSGVLAEAIGAHVPVVATPFPHAVEMAEVGAVALADYADPEAMAVALRQLIADPQLRGRMVASQARISPQLAWRSVAETTIEIVHKAIRGVAAA